MYILPPSHIGSHSRFPHGDQCRNQNKKHSKSREIEIYWKKEKGVSGEEKDALGSENNNYLRTKIEC